MILEVFLLIVGLVLVVMGADYLVDGSSSIAKKLGVSDFVIGLTVVGMGTSAPEMVVSFIGAIQGNADIAIGNVVGSNILNVFLILGITSLLLPMNITRMNRRKDIPINIGITAIFLAIGLSRTLFGIGNDTLSRADGIILLILFATYLYTCFKFDNAEGDDDAEEGKCIKPWLACIMIVGGLAALIFGGRLFVNSATAIAKMLHVSDKFIAVTILAGGTSMPELATCIVAAAKKKGQLALGNIIGSNVFNILLILGGSALIHPLSLAGLNMVDVAVLMGSALLLWGSVYTGKKNQLDRFDGAIFLLIEIGYMVYLISQQ